MRVTPQVTFSADYRPRIKRTKWLRMMRLDFLSKHENTDRNLVTFRMSVSWLLWYLSNWSAFLGAQRAVFKPYVQYTFLVSTPCFANSAVPMRSPFYIFLRIENNLFQFSNLALCKMFRPAVGPTQPGHRARGFSPLVKRPVLVANCSTASNAEARNERSCTAALRIYALMRAQVHLHCWPFYIKKENYLTLKKKVL